MKFTDSIEENVEVLRELLGGVPAGARNRAKQAASAVENMVVRLQADHPKDPVVALGTAFAIFVIAQRFIQAERGSDGKSMIQLLS
jgi:hypothetical protein